MCIDTAQPSEMQPSSRCSHLTTQKTCLKHRNTVHCVCSNDAAATVLLRQLQEIKVALLTN